MFVSYVQPQDQGDPIETLGILVNKWEDGTRGTVIVLSPNGGQTVHNNVPLEGQQFEGGVHIKLSPPANLSPEPPPANGGTTANAEDSSYTVGS